MATTMQDAAKKAATDSQVSFIQLLKSEREVPEALLKTMRQMWRNGLFDDVLADSFIKIISKLPERKKVVAHHVALVGYHRLKGRYFKVYRSNAGFMYAKEIVFDGNGGVEITNMSSQLFKVISVETLLPQHLAVRLDRKLRAQKKVV